jgi:N,N-dimethylformamidase
MDSNLNNLPAIIGYVTPFSGRPGDTLSFKISSQGDRDFSAAVARIDCSHCKPTMRAPNSRYFRAPALWVHCRRSMGCNNS